MYRLINLFVLIYLHAIYTKHTDSPDELLVEFLIDYTYQQSDVDKTYYVLTDLFL